MTAMFYCGLYMLFDAMTGFNMLQLKIGLAKVYRQAPSSSYPAAQDSGTLHPPGVPASAPDNSTARQVLGHDGPHEAAKQHVSRLSKVILRNLWRS